MPCRHCGCPTGERDHRVTVCGSCAVLTAGCEEPDPPAPAVAPTPDAALLRAQLDAAADRREIVWLQGRIALLSRCRTFGPMARPQPR